MFFVGFKAPSFLHIFAIRKMKSRTPEPELQRFKVVTSRQCSTFYLIVLLNKYRAGLIKLVELSTV